MTQLVHKFLENEERGRNIVAAVGISAGIVLLAVAAFATFALR